MRTQSINSAEKKNTNVIAAGVGGAAAAGVATRFIPLTHNEHLDAFTKTVRTEIKNHVNEAKGKEFDAIVQEFSKNETFRNAGDVFVKNKDAILKGTDDKIAEAAKDLDDVSKSVFKTCAKRVSDVSQMS